MWWDTIKKILRNGGGRCIIIENNKPSYVISTFEEFEFLINKDSHDEELEKANKEISVSLSKQVPDGEDDKEDKKEIKIEDLPF